MWVLNEKVYTFPKIKMENIQQNQYWISCRYWYWKIDIELEQNNIHKENLLDEFYLANFCQNKSILNAV